MKNFVRNVLPIVAVLVILGELVFFIANSPTAHAIDIPTQHRRNPQPQRVNPTDKHVLLVMPVGSKTVWYASKIIKHASGMGGTDTAFVNSETGETVKIIGMGTVIITEPPKPEASDSFEKHADKER